MEEAKVKLKGRIKFFSTPGGYGFIQPADGGKDIFFHITSAPDYELLERGSEVQFELGSNRQGPVAIDIQVV